nr:MAG TPA: hypothetical protein [Caudoviricetes sp.]
MKTRKRKTAQAAATAKRGRHKNPIQSVPREGGFRK